MLNAEDLSNLFEVVEEKSDQSRISPRVYRKLLAQFSDNYKTMRDEDRQHWVTALEKIAFSTQHLNQESRDKLAILISKLYWQEYQAQQSSGESSAAFACLKKLYQTLFAMSGPNSLAAYDNYLSCEEYYWAGSLLTRLIGEINDEAVQILALSGSGCYTVFHQGLLYLCKAQLLSQDAAVNSELRTQIQQTMQQFMFATEQDPEDQAMPLPVKKLERLSKLQQSLNTIGGWSLFSNFLKNSFAEPQQSDFLLQCAHFKLAFEIAIMKDANVLQEQIQLLDNILDILKAVCPSGMPTEHVILVDQDDPKKIIALRSISLMNVLADNKQEFIMLQSQLKDRFSLMFTTTIGSNQIKDTQEITNRTMMLLKKLPFFLTPPYCASISSRRNAQGKLEAVPYQRPTDGIDSIIRSQLSYIKAHLLCCAEPDKLLQGHLFLSSEEKVSISRLIKDRHKAVLTPNRHQLFSLSERSRIIDNADLVNRGHRSLPVVPNIARDDSSIDIETTISRRAMQ